MKIGHNGHGTIRTFMLILKIYIYLKTYLRSYSNHFDSLVDLNENVQKLFKDLVNYFGESDQSSNSQLFFSLLNEFQLKFEVYYY